jgi:hypothetical protein
MIGRPATHKIYYMYPTQNKKNSSRDSGIHPFSFFLRVCLGTEMERAMCNLGFLMSYPELHFFKPVFHDFYNH